MNFLLKFYYFLTCFCILFFYLIFLKNLLLYFKVYTIFYLSKFNIFWHTYTFSLQFNIPSNFIAFLDFAPFVAHWGSPLVGVQRIISSTIILCTSLLRRGSFLFIYLLSCSFLGSCCAHWTTTRCSLV